MKEQAKTRSERKHEAIVDAAKCAFQEYGVQGTSMDKVAEMANVSKRTVYNHFETKEALVFNLLSDLWTQSMIQIDIEYQADRPLAEQLQQLVVAEINLVSGPEFLGLARMATGFFLYQPEKLQAEVEKFHDQETAFHRWLRAAVADGRLKKMDIPFAVKQLHNLVKGSCYWPQLLGFEDDLKEEEKRQLAEETVAMFLSHYREAK